MENDPPCLYNCENNKPPTRAKISSNYNMSFLAKL